MASSQQQQQQQVPPATKINYTDVIQKNILPEQQLQQIFLMLVVVRVMVVVIQAVVW